MPSRFVVSEPACRAEHSPTEECSYRIHWQINPHMVPGSVDAARARAQHAAFVRTLRLNAAHVEVLPFVHGAYDSVFAKDCAIVVEDRALLATPAHAERRNEIAARRIDLDRIGLDVRGSLSTPLEGGDVVLAPTFALLGHGFRSTKGSSRELARFLERDVVPLELCDPHLYHLDTALNVLDDGIALVCREAFTALSLRVLESLPLHLVAVDRAEALRFAVNVVEIGDTLVTGTDSPALAARLRALGRRVVFTPLDQFHRAGGSAACLVAPRYDRASKTPASAMRSTAA